ncbi:MAG TPA: glycosyltransferase family 4 protein [Candidatus Angelobacter sp.]|nr:glycosyltransferase family 4 protein [Candidatus Angelobacter sp.]
MKILYLNSSGGLGGAEVCLLDMIASLKQEHPEWTFGLITAQDGPLVSRAAALGVTTRVLPLPPRLSRLGDSKRASGMPGKIKLGLQLAASVFPVRAWSRQLHQAIEEFAPDLIHSNTLKMHVLGSFANRTRRPLIWHLHDYIGSRPFMRRALRFCRNRCTAVLANSNSVRDDARHILNRRTGNDELGGPEVLTVYNAVDLNEFSPHGPAANLDALCGLQPPAAPVVRVGLLATMAWWKGHRDFIEALDVLQAEAIRGYMIGGPLYESVGSQESLDDLKALSAELGLQDQFGFTGFVEKPAEVIRALDIVVHASTRPEPFGRVVVEAMACGKPVITTALGGAAELVSIGDNALNYQAGEVEKLTLRIFELARSPQLRQKLGSAGRETAEKKFDRRRLGKQLGDAYSKAKVGRKF